MSLMQCKNSKILNAIKNIFCVMLYSNIECLVFSFVFVVVGMYNLILLTSSICLDDRYQETPVLQNV